MSFWDDGKEWKQKPWPTNVHFDDDVRAATATPVYFKIAVPNNSERRSLMGSSAARCTESRDAGVEL